MACVLADLAWFEAGRRYGDAIVHFIFRFSSKKDPHAARAKQLFTRLGLKALLISKFVIGLDTIVAPLAGISGSRRLRFIAFDAAGATIFVGLYAGLGYVFSTQLEKVVANAGKLGELLVAIGLLVVAVLIGRRFVSLRHLLQELRLARITPEELKRRLDGGDNIVIVDVQGCVFHRALHGASIPRAIRIDGRRLGQYKDTPIPDDWRGREVILYCSCPNELTSARVALLLRLKGIEHVRPLAGGLQAWRDRGFPVSSAVTVAPVTKARGPFP